MPLYQVIWMLSVISLTLSCLQSVFLKNFASWAVELCIRLLLELIISNAWMHVFCSYNLFSFYLFLTGSIMVFKSFQNMTFWWLFPFPFWETWTFSIQCQDSFDFIHPGVPLS